MPPVNYKYRALLDRKNDFLFTDLKKYEPLLSEIDPDDVLIKDKQYHERKGADCKYCSCKDICLVSTEEIVSNRGE